MVPWLALVSCSVDPLPDPEDPQGGWAKGGEASTEVVIVGGGMGGIAAAIQAARMGADVVLIEQTDYLGGQGSAGGVPNFDEYTTTIQDNLGGLYNELVDRLRAYYGTKPV